MSVSSLDSSFSITEIEAEAKRRLDLKEKLRLALSDDEHLQFMRKSLKKITTNPNPSDILKNYKTKAPLPKSFNWATQLEGIVTQAGQSAGFACTASAIFSSIADHFLIARKVSEPIVFSDMYFYSIFTANSNSKSLIDPYTGLKLRGNVSRRRLLTPKLPLLHSGFPFSMLLYIQLYGIMTDRCLPRLPGIPIYNTQEENDRLVTPALELADKLSPLTCYYKNPNLYSFFIKGCIALTTTSSNPKNVWIVQEIMKRHILTYGPVVVNFRYTKNFQSVYRQKPHTFYSDKNPNGIFLERYNYVEDKYKYEEEDTNNFKYTFHVMSIIGWDIGVVHSSLLNQSEDDEMVKVPYWICRNSWTTARHIGPFVHIAMYPYNKVLNVEGVGAKAVPSSLEDNKIYEFTNAVFLFKAGDIRDTSRLISAASDEDRKKLDELYKLDHDYMQQRDPYYSTTFI